MVLSNTSSCAQMLSKAKQTKMMEFGAEKGLLQGQARRIGGLCPKNPKLPKGFQQSIFKDQVREGYPRVWDQFMYNSLIG